MLLSDLKAIIDEIDNKYDRHRLFIDFLAGKEAEINISVVNYLGHKFLQVDIDEIV